MPKVPLKTWRRVLWLSCFGFLSFVIALSIGHQKAQAAADMWITVPASINMGETVEVTVRVNTNGTAANAFSGTITYDATKFTGIRSSFSGSVCSLYISSPDPAGGAGIFSCGKGGGFTGSGIVTKMVLQATDTGTTSFGLSNCEVLANDGLGTAMTGGCAGSASMTINPSVATAPPPTQSSNNNGGSATSATPVIVKVTVTPTPKTKSPTPSAATVAPETPQAGTVTAEPTAPPVTTLAPEEGTPTPSATPTPESKQQRTIGQAVQDVFKSFSDFKKMTSSLTGLMAIMAAVIPMLALIFGILLLAYRVLMLDRKRKRAADRLFELELAELSALEGKLDLLSEKGTKSREQYRDEFKKVKENILRQIKPEYGKSISADTEPEPTATETPPSNPPTGSPS